MCETSTRPVHPDSTVQNRRWLSLTVLSASLLVIAMDMTILTLALPQMAAELHPTANEQLWIVDSYSLVLAGLLIPWAAVGDRVGRRAMLLTGYSIFAVVSCLVLAASTPQAVIALRVLLGMGGAMIMPTTVSLLRVIFVDDRERATALSIWAAVSGIGVAIGPLVGGMLLEAFSWHAAFLINVPLMAIAVTAGLLVLPESKVTRPPRWDWLGAGLSITGMTSLVWSIKAFAEEVSLAVPEAWLALCTAGVALSWFGWRCSRIDHPLLDLGLFRSRSFSAGILAALMSTFTLSAAMYLVAQWLQLVLGATPLRAGIIMLPVAVSSVLSSLAAPGLADRLGARTVLAAGLALAGAGMLVISVGPDGITLTLLILSLVLVGAGMGSLAIASALIVGASPEEKAGNAGALEETAYELGSVLGVAMLGSLAALLYRTAMQAELAGVDAESRTAAQESLSSALEVAAGLSDPAELIARASESFSWAIQVTGTAGGVLMLAAAAVTYKLTPAAARLSGHR